MVVHTRRAEKVVIDPPPSEAIRLPASDGTGVGLFSSHLSVVVTCSIIVRPFSSRFCGLFVGIAVRKLGPVRHLSPVSRRISPPECQKEIHHYELVEIVRESLRVVGFRAIRSETPQTRLLWALAFVL